MIQIKRAILLLPLALLLTDAFPGMYPLLSPSYFVAKSGKPRARTLAMAFPIDTRMGGLARLLDEMNNDFWNPVPSPSSSLWKKLDMSEGPVGAVTSLKVDVAEDDKQYSIKADMPGVAKDDVKISFDNGSLTISAERKDEREETKGEEEGKGQPTYYYKEVSYGKAYRSFKLPPSADVNGADAKLDNGVLTITLPKRELPSGRTIEVK